MSDLPPSFSNIDLFFKYDLFIIYPPTRFEPRYLPDASDIQKAEHVLERDKKRKIERFPRIIKPNYAILKLRIYLLLVEVINKWNLK